MFYVDGIVWDVPCGITQKAQIKSSKISGYMMDGTYFNDVEGTYLTYNVEMVVPFNRRNDFSVIYEKITDPVDGHLFMFPYDNSTIVITARVSNVEKIWVRLPNGENYWKGIAFDVTSNGPTKFQTLGQVITRGRTPLPDVADPSIGDSYTYTANGWVASETYGDADDMYF